MMVLKAAAVLDSDQRGKQKSVCEMVETNVIHNMGCLEGMKQYPDNFFHCCVTSPPYWLLRDYGAKGQIGLEERPEAFIEKLVLVFQEVKRVLRDNGTLWIVIGDTYYAGKHKKERHHAGASCSGSIKTKELVGIPWMLAFALRGIGFYLRQDIIWHKPNPLPEAVTDRCTKSHEYIFLLTKSPQYFYNQKAALQTMKAESVKRKLRGVSATNKYAGGINGQKPQGINKARLNVKRINGGTLRTGTGGAGYPFAVAGSSPPMVNLRSVWSLPAQGFRGLHYAAFPMAIPYRCISIGCEEKGIVLDPFMGAGTTAVAARKLQRNYVGFEINGQYVKAAERRLHHELGLFK